MRGVGSQQWPDLRPTRSIVSNEVNGDVYVINIYFSKTEKLITSNKGF